MCSQPPRDIDDHYLVDDMLAAGAMKTEYVFEHSVVSLVKELSQRPKTSRIHVSKPGLNIEIAGS